jgi:hypothetical protein
VFFFNKGGYGWEEVDEGGNLNGIVLYDIEVVAFASFIVIKFRISINFDKFNNNLH